MAQVVYLGHMETTNEPPASTGAPMEFTPTAPSAARATLLANSPREYTPVRHMLVQRHEKDPTTGERASTLATLLRERKHRSLTLYLLLLTAWSGLEHADEPLGSYAWVRALSSDHKGALTWSESTLSRTWSDLESRGLITRTRESRLVRIAPRREDGKADYTKPAGGKEPDEHYFTLPHSFWKDEWFARLKMPALAVFLIIAKETNAKSEIHPTLKQFEDWYGISRKSAQAGVKQLHEEGLLSRRFEQVWAPLSKTGYTTRVYYSLTGDFGYESRKAAQARATKAVRARAKPAEPPAAEAAKTPSS